MSKREIVMRLDVRTLALMGACAAAGVLAHLLSHGARQVVAHLPQPPTPAAAPAPAAANKPAEAKIATASGFVLGVADGATKIFKEPESFRGARTAQVQLELARNEVEAFQVALYQAREPLPNVRVELSDLVHDNAHAKIDRGQLRAREVRYVKTERPDYPVSRVGWWPDPLVDAESVNVRSGEVQPIWVDVRARQETIPGHYRGSLTLRPSSGAAQTIQIDVLVRSFALPTAGHLKTAFDLYPGRLRRAYEEWLPEAYARWKDRMGELQHRYFVDLVEHRVSPIWNVDPVHQASFDERIANYLKQGMTAFGVGEHGGSFDNNWPDNQGSLDALAQHYREMAPLLRRQGLLERAYVYLYDEPPVGEPKVARVAKAIHGADPQLKNLVVLHDLGDPAAGAAWWKDLDIIVVRNTAVTDRYLDLLRQWGKEIWLYVSGPSHPYPTLVLDYPAMAARILPWMCWKARSTGLLYWSVNYWTKNPWDDPANTTWGQNGNGSLMYPGAEGPVDSIRLEALRDGLEDYEYLVLLQQLAARVEAGSSASDPDAVKRVAQAQRLLAIDPDLAGSMRNYATASGPLMKNRRAIARLIEILQKQIDETRDSGATSDK